MAPAVEHLIGSYPKWSKVEELPVDELEDRMKVIVTLVLSNLPILIFYRWWETFGNGEFS